MNIFADKNKYYLQKISERQYAFMNITADLNENVKNFKEFVKFDKNFDMIFRSFKIGNQKAGMFLIDGNSSAQTSTQILRSMMDKKVQPGQIFTENDMLMSNIPFVEIATGKDLESSAYALMLGSLVLFVDKIDTVFVIDAKSFPQRDTTEPEKDKVVRGSHDGFVEISIFNSALVRRRIRSEQLCMERFLVGKQSKSDIVVCYMDNLCDKKFLKELKNKLESIDIQALTMNQETLSEALFPPKWYNPYPVVRYSERPDETSAAILQGGIVLLIDNSSSAMILPTHFIDFLRDANDYYFRPITAFYYRIVKTLLLVFSVVFTPIWLYYMNNPEQIPGWLEILRINSEFKVPIFVQLLVMEFVLEVVRISTLNTPSSLGGSLSIVGALLIGEYAVSSGWLTAETIFYMAFLAIALYVYPNFEFGYALKFIRIVMLCMVQLFGLWGLGISIVGFFIFTASIKAVDGSGYFYPFIPFSFKKIKEFLGRGRLRR